MRLQKENWNKKWNAERRQYEKIWFSSYSFKRIREEIVKRIKGKNLKICEFGAGGGLWLKWFKDHYKSKVFGIDNSKIGLNITKKRIPEAVLRLGDVRKTLFKKEVFDLVYCLGLIEHFDNRNIQIIINEMYKTLKKGGNIIITTPNRSKHSLLKFYEKIFGACKSERSLEISQIKRFLERANFKKIEIIPVGLFAPKLRNKKWFSNLNFKLLENFITSDCIVAFAIK
ncbi:MAG: class I SAM-dependent methyltransferase [Candidatus Pacearchaeota archaeon]